MGDSKGKLSEQSIQILCYCEQRFWEFGALPTSENIASTLGISETAVRNAFKNETFRTALAKRGVDFSVERSKGLLSLTQLTLANSLLNLHDKRSAREKLQELNVSSQQYNAWLRDPAFRDYLAKRGEELFKSHDHEAYSALVGTATGGDTQALKLFFEMRGIYTPKQTVEFNVEQVMGKIIEIITRHVQDPATLAAIAEEFEQIDGGPRRVAVRQERPAIETKASPAYKPYSEAEGLLI